MIMRESCGTWPGVRTHHEFGERLCGACQQVVLAAELVHWRPPPLPRLRAPLAEYPPITPESVRHNRRVLAQALGCEDDAPASAAGDAA